MGDNQINSTDARIIVLKKQHYLDTYEEEMECQYSCWGYYDGVDIVTCETVKNGLHNKETNSPLSMLWYGLEKEYAKLRGTYGIQTVGIFRENDSQNHSFWADEPHGIYFCICFIQLYDRKPEEREHLKYTVENDMSSGSCKCLVYYTIDNAELVAVLSGYSLKELQMTVSMIEKSTNVAYLHAVEGIRYDYLSNCRLNGKILESWAGRDCNTSEEIKELRLKLAVSDMDSIKAKKEELENNSGVWPFDTIGELEDFYWYHSESHESLILSSQNMKVKNLIKFLIPGGLITHQNDLYSQGLYNIHTSVIMNSEPKEISSHKPCAKSSYSRWCSKQMIEFAGFADKMQKYRNDGFYACLSAVMYSLNTLAQYEGFCLSNDLYALLIPSVKMFVDSFKTAWETLETRRSSKSDYLEKLFTLKKDTKAFQGKINTIIYHAIHTDQVYLMLPGNCGTPYVLPVRLQLVYLWYVNKLTELFNDQENVKYQFFIEPVSEDKPETYKITLGLERKDSLINLVLPQRSLYFPRSLLLILCHETMHYVNEKIRKRADRFLFLASAYAEFLISYYMEDTISIIEEAVIDKEKARLIAAFKRLKFEMQEYLLDDFCKTDASTSNEEKYLADNVEKLLGNRAYTFFANASKRKLAFPQTVLDELNSILEDADKTNSREYIFKTIHKCIQKMGERAIEMMITDEADNGNRGSLIQNSLSKIMQLSKEIFADMVAVNTLDCTFEHFEEAFALSEGLPIDDKDRDYVQTVRSRMMDSYINKGDIMHIGDVKSPDKVTGSDGVYFNKSVDLYIRMYIAECAKTMNCYMKKIDLSEIRKVYQYFVADGEKYTMRQLMDMFDGCRQKYEQMVSKITE